MHEYVYGGPAETTADRRGHAFQEWDMLSLSGRTECWAKKFQKSQCQLKFGSWFLLAVLRGILSAEI